MIAHLAPVNQDLLFFLKSTFMYIISWILTDFESARGSIHIIRAVRKHSDITMVGEKISGKVILVKNIDDIGMPAKKCHLILTIFTEKAWNVFFD